MSLFDPSSERSFGTNPLEPDERAVMALLKPPALSYIRDLRRTMDEDPNFLTFHDRSVSLKIQDLLSREGIYWDDEIFQKQFLKVVKEAIDRLKKAEQP